MTGGGDTDKGGEIEAAKVVTGSFSGTRQRDVPQRLTAISINRVRAVVFGERVHNVVQVRSETYLRKVERLGIDLTVHREKVHQPKVVHIHVGRREHRLA